MKIPALRGRGRTNSLLILEIIAMEGPLLKYDVYKKLEEKGISEYSTITRRIDSLKEKGYLNEAGRRKTERGKRKAESMYGLTWKGLIASLVSRRVRENALQVIEKNPLLVVPEKEFILLVLRDIFDPTEIEEIVSTLLYGYLKAIPILESINEEELWIWIIQALREIPPNIMKVTEMPEKEKDLIRLLDNPKILQYVKEKIIPKISEYERNFYVMFQFFKTLDQLGDFVKRLNPEDKPSERLREYLKTMRLEDKTLG
jgi:DNA-binding PadR family transcriptional regulator